MSYAKTIFQAIGRTLYPPGCSLCNEPVTQSGALCVDCWKGVAFCTGPVCCQCGIPVAYALPDTDSPDILCESCHRYPHHWRQGRCAFAYEGTGKDIILALKHADRTDLVPLGAQWLAQVGRDQITAQTLLVPVPLHWTRMLKRKYNQATELARALSHVSGAPFATGVLKRCRQTASQGYKKREARYDNVRDAFMVCQDIRGQHIILIDDVMTTGATLDSCAQVLYASGAHRVDVLVLARVVQELTTGPMTPIMTPAEDTADAYD